MTYGVRAAAACRMRSMATTGAIRLIWRSAAGKSAWTFDFAASSASTRRVSAGRLPSLCRCCSRPGRDAHGGSPVHRRRSAWRSVARRGVGATTRIEKDTEAATLVRLIRRFVDLVHDAGITDKRQAPRADAFDAWLTDTLDCSVRAVVTSAAGLAHDGAAVRAALTLPWSNGQTEGQVNKLKLLKRSIYGRAMLDLLRQRLLLAT